MIVILFCHHQKAENLITYQLDQSPQKTPQKYLTATLRIFRIQYNQDSP